MNTAINMSNPIHTKRQGPFKCRGGIDWAVPPSQPHLTPTQAEWMRINKPLYFTGIALNDLPHLPQQLRFA